MAISTSEKYAAIALGAGVAMFCFLDLYLDLNWIFSAVVALGTVGAIYSAVVKLAAAEAIVDKK